MDKIRKLLLQFIHHTRMNVLAMIKHVWMEWNDGLYVKFLLQAKRDGDVKVLCLLELVMGSKECFA
jgi:hypothetical protein